MMTNVKEKQHSVKQSEILNAALEYAETGYSVIPVQRNKKPYFVWKEFQSRIAEPEEIEAWWGRYPEANVAIVMGPISGLCAVDSDGLKGAQWIQENLPKTFVWNISRDEADGHFHAIYRWPTSNDIIVRNQVRLAPEVDIRGEGGYIVAPPSIHHTNIPYRWKVAAGMSWDDIPEYRPPSASFRNRSGGNLNIDLSGVKTSPILQGVPQGQRNATLAKLIGKMITDHNLDDDALYAFARGWNLDNTPPLPDSEIEKTITSIRKTHQYNHGGPDDVKPEVISEEPDKVLPDHLLHPGGCLERLIDYIADNSAASVPQFSLTASFSALGAILGQKIKSQTGLRTNLYCINLGYSGSGKNAPQTTLPNLMLKTTAGDILGPTVFTSDTAIVRWLSKNNNTWMCLDEIGHVMQGMKRPNSPQANIPSQLTKLFSTTNKPELKTYADSANNIAVGWHHLSFYGAGTPERFWESITPSEVSDGFLPRLLIIDSRHDAPATKSVMFKQVPKSLIDELSAFANIKTPEVEVGGLFEGTRPIPHELVLDDDAQAFIDAWRVQYHHLKNKHKANEFGIGGIYGRAFEHAVKVSMIHAMSLLGPDNRRIPFGSVQYACELIDWIVEQTVRLVYENIYENETARMKLRIKQSIRVIIADKKNKYPGANLRQLQRGVGQGMNKKQLKEIIDTLLFSGEIGSDFYKPTRGKSVEYYFVAKNDNVSYDTLGSDMTHSSSDSSTKSDV